MDKDIMPPGGAKQLLHSEDGRKYLTRLRKKHHKDLLQPGQPGFEKAWGSKKRATERMHQDQKDLAAEEWERKNFKDSRNKDTNHKKFY